MISTSTGKRGVRPCDSDPGCRPRRRRASRSVPPFRERRARSLLRPNLSSLRLRAFRRAFSRSVSSSRLFVFASSCRRRPASRLSPFAEEADFRRFSSLRAASAPRPAVLRFPERRLLTSAYLLPARRFRFLARLVALPNRLVALPEGQCQQQGPLSVGRFEAKSGVANSMKAQGSPNRFQSPGQIFFVPRVANAYLPVVLWSDGTMAQRDAAGEGHPSLLTLPTGACSSRSM